MHPLEQSFDEPVFRPPSEARSLILQVSLGCSWNRCSFCGMYRTKQFRVRPVDELTQEIRQLAPGCAGVRRVFLADGDALAAPQDLLEAVLNEIRVQLPMVHRVGLYADARSILNKGAGGLQRLTERGLGIVYFGVESGDEKTLRQVCKGATVARQLEACQVVRSVGLKLSVMVLLGLAGVEGSSRHARATGRFLATAAPSYAAALTLTPVPGTPLYDELKRGELRLPDQWGMLRELREMLEVMKGFKGQFFANHASNYLPLRLRLPRDREPALQLLDEVLTTRDSSPLRPEWARGL